MGRSDALERVVGALRARRVVRVVGLGGVGKTHLALAALHHVDLPSIDCDASNAQDVDALRRLLADVTGAAATEEDALVEALLTREATLFLVDGLAPVAALAVVLERLSTRAPQHRWLITSRCGSGLESEQVVRLRPLDEDAACELFVEVCRRHGFEPARERLPEVVRRVDRIPLAVVLLAGWAPSLGVDGLLDAAVAPLDLAVPASSSASLSGLRDVLAWSWRRLGEEARRALGVAAVFHGGCDLAAFFAVAASGDAEAGALVLRELIDANLAVREGERIALYETVRDLALEWLDAAGLRAEAERRHAAYFADRVAAWRSAAEAHGDDQARRHLEVETPNLLVAVDRMQPVDPPLAGRVLLGLLPHVLHHGPSVAMIRRLDRLLGGPAATLPDALHAELRLARGLMWFGHRADFDGGRREVAAALDLARAAGAVGVEAKALRHLASIVATRDPVQAKGLWRQAVACHGALGHRREALAERARAAWSGAWAGTDAPVEALAQLGAAAAAHADGGDLTVASSMRIYAAHVLLGAGAFASALRELDAAASLAQASDDAVNALTVDFWRGRVGLLAGPIDAARDALLSCLQRARALTYRPIELGALRMLGVAELLDKRPEHALRYFEAVAATDIPMRSLSAWRAALDARLGGEPDVAASVLARAVEEEAPPDEVRLLEGVVDVMRRVRGDRDAGPALERARARCVAGPSPSLTRLVSDLVQLAQRWLDLEVGGCSPPSTVLTVGRDGSFFSVGGGPTVSLARRAVLRALLRALAEPPPHAPVSVEALRAAGWPGQSIRHDAAMNRLYVAIRVLRKLGLRDLLITTGDGYALAVDRIDRVDAS